MDERLIKVIALMDSATDGEAASAFSKARQLLQRDGRRFRDMLGNGTAGRAAGDGSGATRRREAAEVLALRCRVAELERQLGDAHARVESAERGLSLVEEHLDGLHRKYRTALEQKDRAITRLRRQLAGAARAGRGETDAPVR